MSRNRAAAMRERLAHGIRQVEAVRPAPVEGSLTRIVGLALEAVGSQAAIGDTCDVLVSGGEHIEAEVVGFAGDRLYLMPTGDLHGLEPNARVVPRERTGTVGVGPQLLGRIVDGAGEPLDDLGPLDCDRRVRLAGRPINPLQRRPISEPLDVGIRAINGLLTV
ncbi:MAG: flagellum-specific ATP synthase FliI, partial [Steroidobacteraceae bacterium]